MTALFLVAAVWGLNEITVNPLLLVPGVVLVALWFAARKMNRSRFSARRNQWSVQGEDFPRLDKTDDKR